MGEGIPVYEAARAVLRYGLEDLGLERIIAICFPENVGSWRVMEKAGMRFVGTASYYGLARLKKYVAERGTWSDSSGTGASVLSRT